MTIEVHTFHVEGISSLLMNNPAGMGGGQPTMGAKKIPTPEEEAAAKVYRSADGTLYLPSIQFRSSLLNGCTGKRIGKVGAARQVSAGVFNVETETPLKTPGKSGKPIKDYRIHQTRAVVQKQGVIRARAEVPEWAADVVFEIDTDFITVDQVRELLNVAGRIAGVGDWRPAKKGPHGRYRVV